MQELNVNVIVVCVALVVVSWFYFDSQKTDVQPDKPDNRPTVNYVEDIDDFNAKMTQELEAVREEFKKIPSQQDKRLIHKLFLGSALYLYNSDYMANTKQFNPILARVQSSYSWDSGKYRDFTDDVERYLDSEGYSGEDAAKVLKTDEDRRWLANVFAGLAEATRYE